ncbi:toprim domain-containing protein [Alteromonas lipotrueae]|uniref:toprim domain-containing protein n=1 Tax=Alteromonas lipotrueae TaxID=2803814 RepID=UPI001C48557C|nr:toprim domain-containing protein [Alteromonas lipotrueae]
MQPSIESAWDVYSPSTLVSKSTELHFAKALLRHYHNALVQNESGLRFFREAYGIYDDNTLKEFHVGFCDRTFPKTLPKAETIEGERCRGFYERLRLINGVTGHETFRGMDVLPIFNLDNELIGAFGKRRADFPKAMRGKTLSVLMPEYCGYFYNHAALSSYDHITLCESPFDVLSFASAGVRNVVSLLDLKMLEDSHLYELLEHGITTVTLALSRTPSGDRYFSIIKRQLEDVDITVKKLSLCVGESVSSLWAMSKRFESVMCEIEEINRCQNSSPSLMH